MEFLFWSSSWNCSGVPPEIPSDFFSGNCFGAPLGTPPDFLDSSSWFFFFFFEFLHEWFRVPLENPRKSSGVWTYFEKFPTFPPEISPEFIRKFLKNFTENLSPVSRVILSEFVQDFFFPGFTPQFL